MKESSPIQASKAPAIARAAAVLRLLGRSDTPLGLGAIARDVALNPSTCLYVLRALAEEELVAFDAATKRYTLEAGVLTLARGWLRQSAFAELVPASLDRLAPRFGVTMLGVQIVGLDHIIVVAAAQGGQNFQLSAEVGSRFPALISATGRCIAAFGAHDPDEIATRFAALRWDDPPGFARWQAEVEQVRERGYAVDDGNYIAGVTVLAAPVWKGAGAMTQGPGHALVAIGIGSALRRSGLDALGEALLIEARGLTRQMGG